MLLVLWSFSISSSSHHISLSAHKIDTIKNVPICVSIRCALVLVHTCIFNKRENIINDNYLWSEMFVFAFIAFNTAFEPSLPCRNLYNCNRCPIPLTIHAQFTIAMKIKKIRNKFWHKYTSEIFCDEIYTKILMFCERNFRYIFLFYSGASILLYWCYCWCMQSVFYTRKLMIGISYNISSTICIYLNAKKNICIQPKTVKNLVLWRGIFARSCKIIAKFLLLVLRRWYFFLLFRSDFPFW